MKSLWVVRTKSGTLLYRSEDGLIKVCRYASKTDAEKDIRTLCNPPTTYQPELLSVKAIRAYEKDVNTVRLKSASTTKQHEDVSHDAAKFLENRNDVHRVRRGQKSSTKASPSSTSVA